MDDNDNKLLNLLEKESEKISLGYKIASLEGRRLYNRQPL